MAFFVHKRKDCDNINIRSQQKQIWGMIYE